MLDVKARDPGDVARLDELIGRERDAKQRDRYRVARLALAGESTERVVLATGRGRTFVQAWAYRHRDGGVEALVPRRPEGQPTKLPRDREQDFKRRVLAGPTDADGGVCALRAARCAQRAARCALRAARCAASTPAASWSGSSGRATRCRACMT